MDIDTGRSPDGSGHSAEPEPSSTVSAVPASVPNAGRNFAWSFRFWGHDIEAERRYVRALFERHGFSVGRRQRGALTGVMFGDYDIQKWRNLRVHYITGLHGRINEDVYPITAYFPSGLPDEIDDALLAVSNEDNARRAAQGTEAQRAETATKIGGSVHDGPVPEGNAP